MAVGRSADGLCKLVTLRGSCRAVRQRRRALLRLENKQRRSALFWRRVDFTQWMMEHTVAGGVVKRRVSQPKMFRLMESELDK